MRFGQQTLDPTTQRDLPLLHQRHKMFGLGGVQSGNPCGQILHLRHHRTLGLNELADTLLATGHRQQLTVKRLIPLPIQSRLCKGEIEGDPVPITLGIGQCSIHIKNHCFHRLLLYAVDPSIEDSQFDSSYKISGTITE